MNSILRVPPSGTLFAHPARWLVSHLSFYLLTMALVVVGFLAVSASYAMLVPADEPKLLPVTSPDKTLQRREDKQREETQRDPLVTAVAPLVVAPPPIAYLQSAIHWKAIGSNFANGSIGKPILTIPINAAQAQLPKTEKVASQIIAGAATPRSSTPTNLTFRSDGKKRGMVGLIPAPKNARIAMKSAIPFAGQLYVLQRPMATSGEARVK